MPRQSRAGEQASARKERLPDADLMRKTKTVRCSGCDSTDVAEIVYGYVLPDDKINRAIDSGRITLGGCCVSEDSPKYECNACGHLW